MTMRCTYALDRGLIYRLEEGKEPVAMSSAMVLLVLQGYQYLHSQLLDALTGGPDDTRLPHLEALLADLEQATVRKDAGRIGIHHPDPDAFQESLREYRAMVHRLRAALSAVKGTS